MQDFDISGALGKALENPEMLSKAMEIAKTLSDTGLLSSLGPKSSESSNDSEKDKEVFSKRESSSQNVKKDSGKDRLLLLEALKPYVREDRRDKIDLVIKIMRIAEFAKKNGISL